jgi:RND family efflux transporter MFP subunit
MKTAGIALILLFAALVVAGVVPRLRDARELEAESSSVRATPEVNTVIVKRSGPTSDFVLPGSIEALHESPVYARTSGYVTRWTKDIGAHVQAGELLAQIESPEIDQQAEQAKAQLGQLQAALNFAKKTLDRWKSLEKDSAVTEQELDQYQSGYDAAVANLSAGEANYHHLVELQRFERVVAPFTGVVTSRGVDVGNLVTAGATLGATGSTASARPLFSISGTDTVRVYVDVPQSAMSFVQPGAKVDVLVRELPNKTFRGTVARNARALDAASRTLLTEIQIPNKTGALVPGMYVQVRFEITSTQPPILVPANTLVVRSNGPQVAVVKPNHTIHYQKLELARDFGDQVEVVSGLNDGDQLVVNPSDDIREGVTVRVLQPVGDTPGS